VNFHSCWADAEVEVNVLKLQFIEVFVKSCCIKFIIYVMLVQLMVYITVLFDVFISLPSDD
jgi:hypothetical protein